MLKSHGRTPRLTLGRLLLLALAAAVPMGLTLAMEPPCPIEAPDASGEEVIKMAVVERKPIAIHDLITVLVDESALAASEGEIDRHKKADTEASLKDSALLKGLSLIPDPQSKGDPTLGAEQNKKYRAEGEMETRESVKLSIQCEVITIYPNGLLMLEGSQTLKINSETWETYYHGTFRPEDILPDNSVESRYAFGQRLVKRESGSVHDGYRGGWLQRLLDRYQF